VPLLPWLPEEDRAEEVEEAEEVEAEAEGEDLWLEAEYDPRMMGVAEGTEADALANGLL
jgi:hypothetical protein